MEFQVDYTACLFGALLLLVIPIHWLLSAFFAAVFHELCHIIMLVILNGNIRRIHVYWNGCVIEADQCGAFSRFVCILAGPLGSLSLLFFCKIAPEIAVCGWIQGLFNMVPLIPLDGGRLLQDLLYLLCPEKSKAIMLGMEIVIRMTMMAVVSWMMVLGIVSPPIGFLLIIWNMRLTLRKFPCKPLKIGVQ